MPKRSIPNLASYDPDAYWLVHLEPDYAPLNEYLYPSEAASPGTPIGAHTHPFSVSNVFSSPVNAPEEQHRFDLAPGGNFVPNNLADVSGHGLLPIELNEDPIVPDGLDVVLTPVRQLGMSGFGRSKEWFALSAVDPQTRRPEYSPVLLQQRQEVITAHNKAIKWLCDVLDGHWEMALFRYHNTPSLAQAWQVDPGYPLFLNPAPEPLPDQRVVAELARLRHTHHLLLLTARHELGYIYRKVEQWRKLSADRRPVGCLSQWDWGLITARSRSIPRWINHPVAGTSGEQTMMPKLHHLQTSDLARRYHQIGKWARDVQMAVLDIGVCKQPGCTNPVRMTLRGGSTKGGAPSLYCDDHTTSRKHTTS